MPWRATQDRQVTPEFWQNMIQGRSERQSTPAYLPWENHELFKKLVDAMEFQ